MTQLRGDFRRLWIGHTISQFGSQIGMLAIPLTAAITLDASTFEVGALTAFQYAAFLLVGLPAGAWVDRMRRRPVLIAADLARAGLIASVPAAAVADALTLPHLYLATFAVGVATVFFDVADQSYLPHLVGRERLTAANSRMEVSRSAAYTVGPSLAGAAVQVLTAPVALLVDAASFAWSAVWIRAIRRPEPEPEPKRRDLRREMSDGIRLVLGHPVLRALTIYSTWTVLFKMMGDALHVIFLLRVVGLDAGAIGVLGTVTGVGALAGAFAAGPLTRRFGTAATLVGAAVATHLGMLLIPLTTNGAGLAWYVAGAGGSAAGIVAFNVVAVTLRQRICPDHLLGRMNATMRFAAWGPIPIGALLGGAVGTALGVRPAVWLGAAVATLALAALIRPSVVAAVKETGRGDHISKLGPTSPPSVS
jgi:MFS family permease